MTAGTYNILPIVLGTDYQLLAEQSDVFVPPLKKITDEADPIPVRAYTQLLVSMEKGDWILTSLRFSIGNSIRHFMDAGIGIDIYSVIRYQLGTFLFSGKLLKNILSRGDHACVVHELLTAMAGDDVKTMQRILNTLAEDVLRKLQQHNIVLSDDPVIFFQQYIQSLMAVDSTIAAQKLSIAVSDPEARFDSVATGIYIDGRPI